MPRGGATQNSTEKRKRRLSAAMKKGNKKQNTGQTKVKNATENPGTRTDVTGEQLSSTLNMLNESPSTLHGTSSTLQGTPQTPRRIPLNLSRFQESAPAYLPGQMTPNFSMSMPAVQPPWLNCLIQGISENFDKTLDNKLDSKLQAHEDRLKEDSAYRHQESDKKLAIKFAEYDVAIVEIGGRVDDVSTEIKDEKEERKSEADELRKKVDKHQIDMAAEMKKMQASIARPRAAPAANPRGPQPAAAALGTPYTDFELEVSISGIIEDKRENLLAKCQEQVFSVVGLNYGQFQIEHCYRAGRPPPPSDAENSPGTTSKRRPRRVVVRFTNPTYKDVTMKKRHLLRELNIFINNSFTETVERDRRRLYPIVAKANKIPEFQDKLILEGDKINFNGKMIGVQNLDELPDAIHPRDICTERRGDTTFFFKQDSPLSNHHPCTFKIWGKKINCSEQAYFAKKAETYKDVHLQGKIMAAKNPGTQKSFGSRLKGNQDWEKIQVATMKQVCHAKFSQNPHLKDFLLNTKGYLAEDNPFDGFWGIKLSRNSPRSSNRANFKLNHMGVILMDLRKDLATVTMETEAPKTPPANPQPIMENANQSQNTENANQSNTEDANDATNQD